MNFGAKNFQFPFRFTEPKINIIDFFLIAYGVEVSTSKVNFTINLAHRVMYLNEFQGEIFVGDIVPDMKDV